MARRALLLEAARRHFAAHGYEASSVNHVAKDAGVSIGTLFKYFPDKAALLEAVLGDFEQGFVEVMSAPRLHVGSHVARVGPLMTALFDRASEQDAFHWALTSGTHALRGKRDRTPGDAMRAAIAAFVRSGMAAGEFRETDADRIAVLAYGTVEAAMRQCFGIEGGRHRTAWARLTAEILLRMVVDGRVPGPQVRAPRR